MNVINEEMKVLEKILEEDKKKINASNFVELILKISNLLKYISVTIYSDCGNIELLMRVNPNTLEVLDDTTIEFLKTKLKEVKDLVNRLKLFKEKTEMFTSQFELVLDNLNKALEEASKHE